jgi:hypothetical protein
MLTDPQTQSLRARAAGAVQVLLLVHDQSGTRSRSGSTDQLRRESGVRRTSGAALMLRAKAE